MKQKKKILLIEGNDSKETREVKKIIKKAGHICISIKDANISLNRIMKVDGVLASASAKRSGIKRVKKISSELAHPYSVKVPKSEGHRAWEKALRDIEFYL